MILLLPVRFVAQMEGDERLREHNTNHNQIVKCVFIFLVLAMLALLVVQLLYTCALPLPKSAWSAGELLGYLGSVLGAIVTFVILRMTILNEQEARLEANRLQVIPLIVVSELERKTSSNILLSPSPQTERALAQTGGRQSEIGYAEYELEKEYIVIDEDGAIAYSKELSPDQAKHVKSGSWIDEEMAKGCFATVQNTSRYLPLMLHSAGAGPAVNVSIWLEKDGYCPTHDEKPLQLSPKQLLVGDSRYVGMLFENYTSEAVSGAYKLVIRYSDVMGNVYSQHQLISIPTPQEAAGGALLFFDFKVNRRLIAVASEV